MESAHRYFRIGAPLILEWTHQSTGICIPYEEAGKIARIRKLGQLLKEEYRPEGIYVQAYIPGSFAGEIDRWEWKIGCL